MRLVGDQADPLQLVVEAALRQQPPRAVEGIRLARRAEPRHVQDAGEGPLGPHPEAERGDDPAVVPADRGRHEHGRHADALPAVQVGQHHRRGEGTRDGRPARQRRRDELPVVPGIPLAEERRPRRGDDDAVRIEHREPVVLVPLDPWPELGVELADLGRAEQGLGADIPRRGELAGERPDLRVVGGDQGQLLMGPEQDADRLDVGVEQGPELAGELGPHDPLDGGSEREARYPEDGGGDRRPDPQLLAEDLACRGKGSDKTPRSIQDRHRSGRHSRESEWGDRSISGVSVVPRNLNLDR